jgi:hypothetical protein
MIKQNPWDLLDLGPLAAEPVVAPATDGAVPTVLGVQR